jgi:type II secretory pathway pseudopilin PulG
MKRDMDAAGMPNRRSRFGGFTIVEAMMAMAILAIAIVGAMAYRYYATMDARRADIHMTASRVGRTLLEGWVSVDGSNSYDPQARFNETNFAIAGPSNYWTWGPADGLPDSFQYYGLDTAGTAVGTRKQYQVTTGNVVFYTILSTRARDTATNPPTPTMLNVRVGWRLDRKAGAKDATVKSVGFTTLLSH